MAERSRHRIKYSQTWITFSLSLTSIIDSIFPNLKPQEQQLSVIFIRLSDIQRELSSAELRVSEEFRDIFERQKVLQRVSNEFQTAYGSFNRASAALSRAITDRKNDHSSPTSWKGRRLENCVAEATLTKSNSSAFLTKKVREFIHQKESFARFKQRKLKSSFRIYTNSISVLLKSEAELMSEIEKILLQFTVNDSDRSSFLREFPEIRF
jgi:hypothetical protein